VSALAFGIGDWDIGEISVRIDETSSMLDSKVVSIALQSPKYDCDYLFIFAGSQLVYSFINEIGTLCTCSFKKKKYVFMFLNFEHLR
jgi:hypothetical protein